MLVNLQRLDTHGKPHPWLFVGNRITRYLACCMVMSLAAAAQESHDFNRGRCQNDYMGDESIGRAAIEKIELAWQADPSKFRVDKKQNRLIYTYPQDGPWYELKYIADELPNSLEAEISGGNQLIMNYEQAQELFGIKFRRWLGIFNL